MSEAKHYMVANLTPKEIVEALDQHIIGQDDAKKSIAIALRNRYRRAQLSEDMQAELLPSNMLMMGPTGVGKTEIARRVSKLIGAPFVKVEATKFTEVGYVGRDVESMIRDLAEAAYLLVHKEKKEEVREEAEKRAEKRLVKLLTPAQKKEHQITPNFANPFEFLLNAQKEEPEDPEERRRLEDQRQIYREKLRRSELEEELVEIEVEKQPVANDMLQQTGMDQVMDDLSDMMKRFSPGKKNKKRVTVAEARRILTEEEAEKLIDEDAIKNETVFLTENHGIIFIDEIDKIARQGGQHGPDVSREGVQRDILPIVEGSVVKTKYGIVHTDHILFIAAGAFHVSRPEDLIPELQGRFPVKVRLESLSQNDYVKILTKTSYPLPKKYQALMAVDGVTLNFTDDGIEALAEAAFLQNETDQNLGARRLVTVSEKVLEDILFTVGDTEITVDRAAVEKKMVDIHEKYDPMKYIL